MTSTNIGKLRPINSVLLEAIFQLPTIIGTIPRSIVSEFQRLDRTKRITVLELYDFYIWGQTLMSIHMDLIKLIIAYTLTGAIVFTAIMTCLSLVGWIKIPFPSQQKKLFNILIVQIVVIGVGVFAGFLNFNPSSVETNIQIRQAEQYKSLSDGLNKYVFATKTLHEFLTKNLTSKEPISSTVKEYNAAITDLRTNEASNLRLLEILTEANKLQQFKTVMEQVATIDKVVHDGLNSDVEKVIQGAIEKLPQDLSSSIANQLETPLNQLENNVLELLKF